MNKDLIVVEKIEKRLRQKRESKDNIFPLSPTHRKELRQLRDNNISELRNRLKNIRKIKSDEFYEKNKEKITSLIEQKIIPQTQKLNKSFEKMIDKINDEIKEQLKLEEKSDMEKISISQNYDDISRLKIIKSNRRYYVNEEQIKNSIKDMFEMKFGSNFTKAQERIDKMLEQYEEAINFGDLELVKELYYGLKDADTFIDEVSKIKV